MAERDHDDRRPLHLNNRVSNPSKTKGSAFERKIANLLSDRFAHHTGIEKSFRRNADSGAYWGGSNSARASSHDMSNAVMGDIVAPANFKFTLECKHYRSPPTLAQVMGQKCATLDRWIEQASLDATTSGLMPVIIMKWDRVAETVMVRDDGRGRGVIHYRGWTMMPLTDWLDREDEYFFADVTNEIEHGNDDAV